VNFQRLSHAILAISPFSAHRIARTATNKRRIAWPPSNCGRILDSVRRQKRLVTPVSSPPFQAHLTQRSKHEKNHLDRLRHGFCLRWKSDRARQAVPVHVSLRECQTVGWTVQTKNGSERQDPARLRCRSPHAAVFERSRADRERRRFSQLGRSRRPRGWALSERVGHALRRHRRCPDQDAHGLRDRRAQAVPGRQRQGRELRGVPERCTQRQSPVAQDQIRKHGGAVGLLGAVVQHPQDLRWFAGCVDLRRGRNRKGDVPQALRLGPDHHQSPLRCRGRRDDGQRVRRHERGLRRRLRHDKRCQVPERGEEVVAQVASQRHGRESPSFRATPPTPEGPSTSGPR
jgi:hypothetical protein